MNVAEGCASDPERLASFETGTNARHRALRNRRQQRAKEARMPASLSVSRWCAAAAFGSVVGLGACGGRSEPVTVDPVVPAYPARAFHETVSFRNSSFSSDETRILLTSDETGIFNVYSQPVDGSARTPLTQSTTESIRSITWFPHDDRFLYTADRGGDELHPCLCSRGGWRRRRSDTRRTASRRISPDGAETRRVSTSRRTNVILRPSTCTATKPTTTPARSCGRTMAPTSLDP